MALFFDGCVSVRIGVADLFFICGDLSAFCHWRSCARLRVCVAWCMSFQHVSQSRSARGCFPMTTVTINNYETAAPGSCTKRLDKSPRGDFFRTKGEKNRQPRRSGRRCRTKPENKADQEGQESEKALFSLAYKAPAIQHEAKPHSTPTLSRAHCLVRSGASHAVQQCADPVSSS